MHSLATGADLVIADRVIDTDSDGLYHVPSLQPGNYWVQATAAGFSACTVPKVSWTWPGKSL